MKNFIYKLILITISIILIFKLTIGDEITGVIKKIDAVFTKEGRKETVNKLRYEILRATKKEKYLNTEDAILINNFLKKIKSELKEVENQ